MARLPITKGFCVYIARCLVDGKLYVGKGKSARNRASAHIHAAFKKDSQHYFHRALRKHGRGAFEWSVHTEGLTEKQAFALEKKLIRELNARSPNGYNMTDGGDGPSGYKFTPEQSEAHSKRRKAYFRRHPEAKKKMAEVFVEMMKDPEFKEYHAARVTEGMAEPGVRRQLRASSRARWDKPSERRKTSESRKRLFREDPGARERNRAAQLIAKGTPESRQQNSEAIQAKWQEDDYRLKGMLNNRAIGVIAGGKPYYCMKWAAIQIGVKAQSTIRKRIDRGVEGYAWADPNDPALARLFARQAREAMSSQAEQST